MPLLIFLRLYKAFQGHCNKPFSRPKLLKLWSPWAFRTASCICSRLWPMAHDHIGPQAVDVTYLAIEHVKTMTSHLVLEKCCSVQANLQRGGGHYQTPMLCPVIDSANMRRPADRQKHLPP